MQRWADSLQTADLTINLGAWEWSAARGAPAWEKLRKAKFWTDPTFEGRRAALLDDRTRPEPVVTAEGDVAQADVEVEALTPAELDAVQAGHGPPTRRIFVYAGTAANTPGQVAACELRAAVMLTGDAGDTAAHRPCAQLETAADCIPVLLYGHPGVVQVTANSLGNRYRELQRATVEVFVYPEDAADRRAGRDRAVRRRIELLYPGGTVDASKVCTDHSACPGRRFVWMVAVVTPELRTDRVGARTRAKIVGVRTRAK